MALSYYGIFALVAIASAGPISYYEPTTQCARQCPDDAEFAYALGQTYHYTYDSMITTWIPGATDEFSRLHLTATASVEVLDRCEMALTMTQVTLEDANPSSSGSRDPVPQAWDFKREVQARPLRFSLVNGRVTDVCPEEAEPAWVLNAKRAVLSGLQITAPKDLDHTLTLQETDVVGECDVTYSPAGSSWSTTRIAKVKDLLACTGRQDSDSMFQSVSYQVPSKLQSLPLLKSSHECEVTLTSDGRVQSTVCSEDHLFRPFSRQDSGASTQVTYSLTFSSQEDAVHTTPGAVERRTSLLFEHVAKPADDPVSVRRDALGTLRTICDETEQGVTPGTPALFLQLTKELRKLDATTLKEVATLSQRGRPCARAGKFMNDALPTLGTPASLSVMRDLLLDGAVSGMEADLWMTSMTFINEPTRQMLAEVQPLLTQPEPQSKAVLAVSSLVHTYCKSHPNCIAETEVSAIISALKGMLGRDCSGDNHAKTILALKALGNAGRIESAVDTVTRCFQNTALPMEVRVSAVGAFRRMGCHLDKTGLLGLLEDNSVDAELRIQAYIMAMQCPDYSFVQQMGRLLAREEVNQVGSFIWTHLTNLAETSSPLKEEIQRLLSNADLQRAFDMDKRKFSRNMEWSMFSETMNAGASVESNLVWSPKSFVPRSATVNLTVDMFGQSVNLMEVGGRVEGLDSMLESFFVPESESTETPNEIVNMDNRFRPTESREPQGSYFLRVFGNEVSFADFHGLDLTSIRERFNYLQWLIDLASEHQFEMTKSMILLDTEICVPTVAGFPLRLNAQGTAVTDLQLSGRVDLRNVASAPRSLALVGRVRPSAALQITGEMGVDAWMAQTGMRMVNTLHTSTLMDGTIELQRGRVFNMDINTPQDTMEIFSAESKFYIMYRESAREQPMLTEGRYERQECTSETMSHVTGMQLCGQVSVPKVTAEGAPWMPLTGPASASITLQKTDTFSQYHFEAKLTEERVTRNVYNHLAAISFTTPGSQVDRELTARFNLDRREKSLQVDIRSPWKKIDVTSSVESSDELYRATGQVTIDNTDVYHALVELPITQNQYNTRYQPRLEVALAGRDPYTLSGSILYRPGKRAGIELALENVFSSPVTLRGELTRIAKTKQCRYEGDVALRAPGFKSQVAGSLDRVWSRTEATTETMVEVKYKMSGSSQQSLSATNRVHYQVATESQQISFTGSSLTSLWPNYDTDYSLLLSKDASSMEVALSSGFTNDKPKRVILNARALHHLSSPEKQLSATATVKAPFLNINYTAGLNHLHSSNAVVTTLTASTDEHRQGRMDIRLYKGASAPLNLSAEVSLTTPGRHMAYHHKLQERTSSEYHHNLTLTLDHYEQIQLLGIYKQGSQHELTASLSTPFTPVTSLDISLVPSMSNMQSSGRLVYGDDEYSMTSSWRHDYDSALHTAANLDITIPSRKITWEGSLRQNGGEISSDMALKWDAENDANKALVTSINVQLGNLQPSLSTRVQWWPEYFVEFTTSLNEQNWRSSPYGLEGTAQLTSSFSGYEQMNAAFTHEHSSAEIRTHGELSWAPERTISSDIHLTKRSDWSAFDSSFTISSPFSELEQLIVEQAFTLRPFATASKIQWNELHLSLETTATIEGWSAITSEVKITSTFPDYEDLTFALHHSETSGHVESNIQALVGSETFSITLNMDHSASGVSITNNGRLTAILPMLNSPNTLVWQHTNDRNSLTSQAVFNIQGDRSILALSGNLQQKTEMSANLDTPYFPAMSAGFTHEPFITVAEATYDGQSLKFENNFNFQSRNLLSLVTKLTTPFTGYEQLMLTLDNRHEDGRYTAVNEFSWGNNQKITLGGAMILRSLDIQVQLQFFSPYTNTVTISMNNRLDNGMWHLSGDLVHHDREISRGTFTLGLGELKKINIDFHSACPYIATLLFDFELNGNIREFDSKIELEHNLLDGKIQLTTEVRTSNINDLAVTMGLITPFTNMESLDITLNHKHQPTMYETTIASGNAKFFNRIDMPSSTTFSTNTYVEPEIGFRYQIQTTLDITENIAASARLQISGEADRTISFTHEGPIYNFRTHATIVYNPQKTITSVVAFSSNDGEGVSGEFTVTTPFQGWEKSSITFEHHGQGTAFNNNGAVELMGKKIMAQSEFSLQGYNVNLRASVTSTFEEFRRASVVFSQSHDAYGFDESVNVQVNDKTFTSSLEFRHGDRNTGQFNMVAPWWFGSLNINFEHSGSTSDFNNNARIQYNGETVVSGESRFRMGNSEIVGSASLTTPFAETTTISFNHQGPLTSFTNNGVVEVMGQQFTGHSEFSLDGYNMQFQANMTTPFETMHTTTMTISNDGDINNFDTSVRVQVNDETFSSRMEFHNGDRKTGQFSMVAPWFFDSLNVQFEHSGSMTDFNNQASIEYNGDRVSSINEFSLSGTNLHALFKILTPEEISLELNHNGAWTEFANSATMKYFDTTFSGNSNFRLQGTTAEANIEAHLPFQGFNDIGAHYTHTGDLANFNCNFNMNMDESRITGEHQMRITDSQFAQSVSIMTPFQGFSRLGYSLTHTGPSNNFNNEIRAFIESNTISSTTAFKFLGNLFKLSTTVNTPWEMVRTFTTFMKHEHDPNNCHNEMRMTLNEDTTSGIVTFTTRGVSKEVIVEFNIAGNSIRATTTHQGTVSNFQNHITITANEQTCQSDVSFSISGNTAQGSASLNTPFSELSNLVLSFSHEGDLWNFNNDITANLNGNTMGTHSEFSLQSDRVHGLLRITTPSDQSEFTLNHRGGLYDFQTTLTANVYGVTISTNAALHWTSMRLQGSLNIQAPDCNFEVTTTNQGAWSDFTNQFTMGYNGESFSIEHAFKKQNSVVEGSVSIARTDDYSAAFSYRHSGILSNFQNEFSMTLNEQTTTISSSFRFTDAVIEGSVNIETPFTELQTASMTMKYEGPWFDCKHETALTFNQNTLTSSAEFKLASSVEGHWNMHWMDSEVFAFEFRHEGAWSDFTNEVSVTVNQQRVSFNNAFKVTSNQLNLQLELNTPFAETISFNMDLQGVISDFTNQMTFTFDQQTLRLNCQFRVQGSDINGSWEVITPFGTIIVTGHHTGEWYSCNSHLSVSVNDNTMEATSHFRKTDSQVEGSLSVNQLNLAFSHNRNDGAFNNVFTVNVDGEEGRVSTNLQMDESGLNGNARVNTPFNGYRTMAVSASTQDDSFILRLQRELPEYSFTTSHNRTPGGGRVSFTMTTPFESASEITGTFSHDGPINDFQQVASLEVNNQRLEYTLIFAKSENGAEGSFEINTPFTVLRNFKIAATHNSLLNNNGYILYNGARYSGSTEFRSTDTGIHGSISIQTPAEYSITIDHSGMNTDFVNQVSVTTGPSTMSMETRFRMVGSTIEASLVFATPETVSITFSNDGEITNFRQSVQVEYSGNTVSQSAEFTLDGRRMSGKFSLAAPCPYMETLNIEFQHQGSLVNFGNSMKMELNGQQVELESEYRVMSAKTIGGISVKTPQEYSLRCVFKGEPSDLTTNVRLTVAGEKSNINTAYKNTGSVVETSLAVRTPYTGYENFATEFNYKNKRNLRVSGSVTTPFENFNTMSFELSKEGTWRRFTINGRLTTPFTVMPEGTFMFTHRGSPTNFECSGSMDLGDQHFAGSTMFQWASKLIEASTTLESPYFSRVGYSFKHEGGIRNFNTEASVELNGDRMESTLSFKSQPAIEIDVTIHTPFSVARDISFSSNFQGSLLDFSSTASVGLDGQAVSGSMAFKKNSEVIESNAELHIPTLQPISYNIVHNVIPNGFHTVISITTASHVYHNFGLELNHEGTLGNFQSSATLTTPFTSVPSIAGELAYSGQMNDFTSSAALNVGSHHVSGETAFKKTSGWTETDMESSLHLSSSFPVLNDLHISAEQHNTASSLSGQAEATYNGNKQLDMDYSIGLGSSRSLITNVRAPILMAISANIQESSSSTSGELSVSYNNRPYRVHFELNNNNELTTTVSWETRTVTMTSRYSITSERFTNFMEIRWSDDSNDKFSYDLELSRSSRGQQSFYDGRLALGAKQYTFTTTFSHRLTPGRQYVTEVNVQGLVLRTDVQLIQSNLREFTTTITLQHASFTRDVVCTINGIIEPETPRLEGQISVSYADQQIDITAKIADESESTRQRRYVAQAHVTHEASALDVQFSSELRNSDESLGGNMELTYMMTRDHQLKNAALRAEINKLREEINMEVQSLENRMSLTGRRTISNVETGHQHFTVSGSVDETNMHAELDMDQSSPSFDFIVSLEPERELHVFGKYLDPSSILLEAYHETTGTHVQDSQMSLRLSDANILNARAYFRPQILDDIMSLLSTETQFGATLNQLITSVSEEFEQRKEVLQEAVTPFMESWQQFTTYSTDIYNQMYEANEFYLRDCMGFLQSYYQTISHTVSHYWETLSAEYRAHFGRKLAELRQYTQEAKVIMVEAAELVMIKIQEYNEMAQETYNNAIQSAQDATLEWIASVRTNPHLAAAMENVMSFEPREVVAALRQRYTECLSQLQAHWDSLMNQPYLSTIKQWVEDSVTNMRWFLGHFEIDETVQGWIDEAQQVGVDTIVIRIWEWVRAQLNSLQVEVVTWSPNQGEAELRVTLPFELEDLRTPPYYDVVGQFRQLQTALSHHMPSWHTSDYTVWDTIYQYKPNMNAESWVPPFAAHATISGSQHYMTFDKTFYEFKGECSYMLARDFIDGRFSVLVNYDRSGKQSMAVHSGSDQIEIRPDFQVTVGGSATDLPYTSGATTIRRIEDTVRVDSEHGVTVLCDMPHDRCTVNVSGWYYAKTGGLLGTYDNEPSSDFLSVDRLPATNTEDFAASWAVGRSCRAVNHANIAPAALDADRYAMCASLFEDSTSPFRPCFHQVNTEAFMNMCLNDVTATEVSTEEAVCNMAAFYVDECQRTGVNIILPTDCVTCELSDGRVLHEGQNVTLEGAAVPAAADVILVVSHAECNQDVIRRMTDLMNQIELNFQQVGVTSVEFGLVGFGAERLLNGAHSHTFSGRLMGSKDEVISALQNFVTSEGNSEDALHAIQFASRYPFRTGASKTIILLPCDACHEGSVDKDVLKHALRDREVSLHVLMQHDFRLRTDTPRTSFIFGVDNEGLFTPKHVGDNALMGDADLRRQVSLPNDICASLSDDIQGSTFNAGQLLHTRPAMQRRFLDVLSRLVVRKGSPEQCQSCQCRMDAQGQAYTVCHSCSYQPSYTPWLSLNGISLF